MIGLDPRLRGGGGGALGYDPRCSSARRSRFIALSLAASKWLSAAVRSAAPLSAAEFFLLAAFAFLVGMAAVAEELGLSEAIGALMAGVVLSETSVREEIEERFFSFRDVFAALFFFVFGLSIDLGAIDEVGWLVAAAVVVTLVGKIGGRLLRRAHRRPHEATEPQCGRGARRARRVHDHPRPDRERRTRRSHDATQSKLVAFSGLYVACHRDARGGADEGVEGDRPAPVPAA